MKRLWRAANAGARQAARSVARCALVRRWWPAAAVAAGLLVAGIAARGIVRRMHAVVVVNRQVITVDEVEARVRQSPEAYLTYLRENPRALIDDIVNQTLLAQAARWHAWKYRRTLNRLVRQYYQEMLVREFVEQELVRKIPVSDEEIRNYYNSHLAEFILPDRYHIREIVVPTEEDAADVLRRLEVGESFEQIAARESVGASRASGGDLGWIPRQKLDPDVARLVERLRPGEISARAVQTEMGFHILKLVASEPSRVQTLEEATPAIREVFVTVKKRERVDAVLQSLRTRANISVSEKNLNRLKERMK